MTIARLPLSFPHHSPGEWRNAKAFAALRADGSVVTWGDSSSVTGGHGEHWHLLESSLSCAGTGRHGGDRG